MLSNAQLQARISALSAPLTAAAQRNFQRWPTSVPDDRPLHHADRRHLGRPDPVDAHLDVQRAAWLDTSGGWLTTVPPTGTPTATPTVTPTRTVSPTVTPTVAPTTPPTTSPPTNGRTCTATYTVTSQWPGGFQGEVRVTAGATAITGWRVGWTFANGQTLSQVWNATAATNGSTVTATNVAYNGSLATRATTSFGFLVSWSTTNTIPTPSCTAS